MHPAVLVAMVVAIVLLFALKRKWAIIPVFAIVIFTPFGQQLHLGGVHLYVPRALAAAGIVRLLIAKFAKKERLVAGGINSIDKAFCVWAIARALAFMLLYRDGGAVTYQIAFLIDAFGGYFLLRYLIRDEQDIILVAKLLAATAAIMACFMIVERFYNLNLFGYAGSFSTTPQFRDGQIRAQGAFGHPILAGSFGATTIPLFFWLFTSKKARAFGIAGMLGAMIMIYAAASSTPVLALLAGILGLSLWPVRNYMRVLRWGIVTAIIGLAMVMKAPVWFVIAHVDVVSASSGWHRAELVNTFVNHFSQWWLVGTGANDTWGYEMIDTSNQFVAEGVTGGLLTLIYFIVIISRGFSRLGRARKLAERSGNRGRDWFLWCLCADLLAHVFTFWGVSYWDQTRFWWFAFLAIISAATLSLQKAPAKAKMKVSRFSPEPVPLSLASAGGTK